MNDFIKELTESGGSKICSCCGRYAKIYRRKPHANMIKQLIHLYKLGGDKNFIHISRIVESTTDAGVCSLRYWGLIERKQSDDEKKKNSGLWKITPLGIDFINHGTEIKKYVLIYDDRVQGFEGAYVNIDQCLAGKFNYKELMS